MSDGAKQLHKRKVFSKKPVSLGSSSCVINVSVAECGHQYCSMYLAAKAESSVQSDEH